MKKFLLVFLICTISLSSCFAKGIVGKWQCPQAVTSQLNLGFEDVLCEYKFKKNGTFVLKISGETLMKNGKYTHDYNHLRRGLIVVKGLYKIEDGLITSTVENEDVECFAEETEDYIDDTDRTPASLYVARNNKEASYKKNKSSLLRQSLLEYRFLWDWDHEPVVINTEEMSVGDQLKCVR